MKYSPADITKLGTILGIWAHPDDEAWTMAGLVIAARKNGQRVVIVTATRGEAGQSADLDRWPKADLAQIRTYELTTALEIMNVREHHWLDLPDGSLPSHNAVPRLIELISEVAPDTIITFAKDGITGHDDHKTVHQWTMKAAHGAGSSARILGAIESTEKYQAVCQDCPNICPNVYFNTEHPATIPMAQVDVCFSLPEELQRIKRHTLMAQPSQTEQLFNNEEGRQFIDEQIACECFIDLRA